MFLKRKMMGKMAAYGKQILLLLCNMIVVSAMLGCHALPSMAAIGPGAQPLAGSAATQQLIIKFKPDTIACDAAGIAQFSSATQIPLEYVRPMSGGACVIKQLAGGAKDFSAGMELLGRHPAVEWLQQDARKKIH